MLVSPSRWPPLLRAFSDGSKSGDAVGGGWRVMGASDTSDEGPHVWQLLAQAHVDLPERWMAVESELAAFESVLRFLLGCVQGRRDVEVFY